jgi:hypothetical protein
VSAVSFTEDFRPTELVAGVFVAAIVLVGAAVAIQAAGLNAPAAMSENDKGMATPVRVIPVLDLDTPLLKLGGKKAKLPDRWVRKKPVPVVEERAVVTTKASKNVEDIPDKEMKIIDAGTEVPDLDASVAKKVDVEIKEASDAGPSAPNTDEKGDPNGVKEGTETDPLKAHVVDQYRARVAGWLTQHFHVHGSGLPPEEITKYKPSAVVQVSGGTVTGFSVTPSGNATFDAAAQSALQQVQGQSIPPPPENYPDVKLTQIHVTFYCTEKKCD